jgi:hypothetical protein
MHFSKLSLSQLVGLFIVMIPLAADADTGQLAKPAACPTLLTELECHDYQSAQNLAKSEAERGLLEVQYAALLKERSRLCRCHFNQEEPEEIKNHTGTPTKRFRVFAGRKISM